MKTLYNYYNIKYFMFKLSLEQSHRVMVLYSPSL